MQLVEEFELFENSNDQWTPPIHRVDSMSARLLDLICTKVIQQTAGFDLDDSSWIQLSQAGSSWVKLNGQLPCLNSRKIIWTEIKIPRLSLSRLTWTSRRLLIASAGTGPLHKVEIQCGYSMWKFKLLIRKFEESTGEKRTNHTRSSRFCLWFSP